MQTDQAAPRLSMNTSRGSHLRLRQPDSIAHEYAEMIGLPRLFAHSFQPRYNSSNREVRFDTLSNRGTTWSLLFTSCIRTPGDCVSPAVDAQWQAQTPQNLISGMDALDRLMDYGDQRIRAICASRNIDWDGLSDDERMRLLDEMLHEDQPG